MNLDPDNTSFWTASGGGNTVYKVDIMSGAVLQTVATGADVWGLALFGELTAGGPKPATLTLTPTTSTNVVGTVHCVTATVTDAGGNPVPNVSVVFSVSGVNSASATVTTDANGHATFCYTGTHVGTDVIHAFADTNGNGTEDAGEPFGDATKIWTPGTPFTLTLAPPAATNPVGTKHCVTATVKDFFGNPVPGVTVVFAVQLAVLTHAVPASGSAKTNASGQATFCFTASLPGDNPIHAFADTNNNGTQDVGEPFGDADKVWTLPVSTAFCEVTITNGGWIIANNMDRANFGGNAKVQANGSVQGEEEYQDQGPAQPMNVHSIDILATTCDLSSNPHTATIYGDATINGSGSHKFRIDVIDGGNGGSNDAYGILLDTGYDSGEKKLMGGNVTIH